MIPLESGLPAQLGQPRLGRVLQIESRGARLYLASHLLKNLADHPARAAHLLDLLGRLQYNRHTTPVISDQFSVVSFQ